MVEVSPPEVENVVAGDIEVMSIVGGARKIVS